MLLVYEGKESASHHKHSPPRDKAGRKRKRKKKVTNPTSVAGAVISLVADANNHMPGLSLEAVALESGEAAPHAHARPRPVDASPLSGLIVISSSSAIGILMSSPSDITTSQQLLWWKKQLQTPKNILTAYIILDSIQLPSPPYSDRSSIAVSSRPR